MQNTPSETDITTHIAAHITTQRLDKFLWHARFLRTRSAATKFVQNSNMRVNGQKQNKAGYTLKIGDVLTFSLSERVRVIEILAFSPRRGNATNAQKLYRSI